MAQTIRLETSSGVGIQDITTQVRDAVPGALTRGICHVFVPHTTAGVFLNEKESKLLGDVRSTLEELVPASDGYAHDRLDDNADAHLRSLLVGSSTSIPIVEGDLALGTWQRVLFFEGDGPRERQVTVTALEA